MVLNDPTRGVDPATKSDLYKLFATLTAAGVAIVLLSTELEELVMARGRVLVFREGGLYADIPPEAVTREHLVAAFFGEVLV